MLADLPPVLGPVPELLSLCIPRMSSRVLAFNGFSRRISDGCSERVYTQLRVSQPRGDSLMYAEDAIDRFSWRTATQRRLRAADLLV